jgi:hypothetical protein
MKPTTTPASLLRSAKLIGFPNRFDALDKRKNNRGFEHEK